MAWYQYTYVYIIICVWIFIMDFSYHIALLSYNVLYVYILYFSLRLHFIFGLLLDRSD